MVTPTDLTELMQVMIRNDIITYVWLFILTLIVLRK